MNNLYYNLFEFDNDINQDVGLQTLNRIYNHLDFNTMCKYNDLKSYEKLLNNTNELKILHINIRSLEGKFDKLSAFIHSLKHKIDVLCVTETWLKPENEYLFNLPNYASYHLSRTTREHGGVSIFVHNRLKSKQLSKYSAVDEEIEINTVKVSISKTDYNICAIYRPLPDPVGVIDFTEHLSNLLKDQELNMNKTILIGDMNINLLNLNTNASTNFYLETMQSLSLFPLISRPTRFPDTIGLSEPSLLDHLFTNFVAEFKPGILHYPFSDHLPIFINIPCPVTQCKTKSISFRDYNDTNKANFTRKLHDIDWPSIFNDGDVNHECSIFISLLNKIFNECFPIKNKIISEKYDSHPWMSQAVLKSIRRKNNLFMDYRLGLIEEVRYKQYRNLLNKIITTAKKTYYMNVFSEYRSNVKEIWKHINDLNNVPRTKKDLIQLKINNDVLSDPLEVATQFNQYFSNIGAKLDSQLEQSETDPLSCLTRNFCNSLNVPPVTQTDILRAIKKLKNKNNTKSEIPVSLIKSNSPLLAYPLTYLFNNSVSQGVFPQCLKNAIVSPIYKSGPKNVIGNYRPISVLNTVSKLFESLMKQSLLSFLKTNNIITEHQYGFIKGTSTFDALNSLTQEVHDALNRKHDCICIYIDFQKAFDTVNHEILLRKLNFYGIRGKVNNWMKSYLNQRTQSTSYGGTLSSSSPITCGVPQGSILGPVLFLLYINDLANIFQDILVKMFADDSSLLLCGPDLRTLIFRANVELRTFYKWCLSNRLSINIAKTKYMIFTNKEFHDIPPLFINFKRIECTDTHKVLGLILDNKLSYKAHINYISSKLAKSCSLLQNMSRYAPTDILRIGYYSYVLPHLSYCMPLYGNTFSSLLQPLFILQKKVVRIISKSSYDAHSNPLFKQLQILPFYELVKYESCIYMYKHRNDFEVAHHNYATRHHDEYLIPFPHLSKYKRSLKCVGPTIWNKLNRQIQNANTINCFKNKLKNDILSKL